MELLGSRGTHGLSHPRVDEHAGVPAGTTSFYFRTRKALMHAIAERMAELDAADLSVLSELAKDTTTAYAGTAGLARLVMMSSTEPYLTRSRARYELVLQLSREPELAEAFVQFAAGFYSLAREVITQWYGPDTEPDPRVVEEQAVVLLTFINGVMMSFVIGAPVVSDAEQLDRWIQTILGGTPQPGSDSPANR
ncbi:MAG: TetR family transcriptional regulator [Mycobacterium sp.]